MSRDAASALQAAAPGLRLVRDDERAVAPVADPVLLSDAQQGSRRRRPLMERLRPHLPCRSDAVELRHTLSALGPSWRIVRGLPDEGVHSLLVGPGGVFALTVQSLAQARVAVGGNVVTIDGRPIPLVTERRLVADALGRRLEGALGVDVRVRALVAVIHSQPRWSFCEQPADGRVTVLPGREIAAFLAALPPVLSAEDVERVADATVAPPRHTRPVLYAI